MLITAILILLVLSLLFGGFSLGSLGLVGWSPAVIVLVVLLILWFSKKLHL